MTGHIASLASSPEHSFSKPCRPKLRLLAGLGVEGDAHCGETVKHRSRVAVDPSQPNLRQVHLLREELLAELAAEGYDVAPGRLGENVLTRGIDLHTLGTGTRLELGSQAVVELTGLRNPCAQLNDVGEGLLQRVAYRDAQGELVRRAGVMAVVVRSGEVAMGDEIGVVLASGPHHPLERV